jgi:hypothetical protein
MIQRAHSALACRSRPSFAPRLLDLDWRKGDAPRLILPTPGSGCARSCVLEQRPRISRAVFLRPQRLAYDAICACVPAAFSFKTPRRLPKILQAAVC